MSDRNINVCIKLMNQIGCFKVNNNSNNDKQLPLEIDSTQLLRYPSSFKLVKDLYWSVLKDNQFDILCGVPFTGLVISYILAYSHNIPFVIKREKAKSHGTMKLIDGVYKDGEKVVIIADVVKGGNNIVKTAEALRQVGLIVTDAVSLIDCDEGAEERLNNLGIKLKSIVKVDSLLNSISISKTNEIEEELKRRNNSTCKPLINGSDIINKLFEIESVKIQNITLKSGLVSPIYVDLRVVSRFPQLLKPIADLYWSVLKTIDFDLICGIPFGALSFAVIIAYEHNIPLIIERNQAKSSGDSISINGNFKAGERVVLIEDVVTSGGSILQTGKVLRENGLLVNNSLAFLDRSQGGASNLSKYDINLMSVLTMNDILKKIEEKDKDVAMKLLEWFKNGQKSWL